MGSLAASIFIGNMHPNDGRIGPTHSALLWEGHRSAWELTDLERAKPATIWRPSTYDRVVPDFLALLAVGVLEQVPIGEQFLKRDVTLQSTDLVELDRLAAFTLDFKGMAMSVTIIDESAGLTLEHVKGFGHRDLVVLTRAWSKIWSQWSGDGE